MSSQSISEWQRQEAEQKRHQADVKLQWVKELTMRGRARMVTEQEADSVIHRMMDQVSLLRREADELEGLSARLDDDKEP